MWRSKNNEILDLPHTILNPGVKSGMPLLEPFCQISWAKRRMAARLRPMAGNKFCHNPSKCLLSDRVETFAFETSKSAVLDLVILQCFHYHSTAKSDSDSLILVTKACWPELESLWR